MFAEGTGVAPAKQSNSHRVWTGFEARCLPDCSGELAAPLRGSAHRFRHELHQPVVAHQDT